MFALGGEQTSLAVHVRTFTTKHKNGTRWRIFPDVPPVFTRFDWVFGLCTLLLKL